MKRLSLEKKAVIVAAAAVIVLAACWRLTPFSFSKMIGVDTAQYTKLDCLFVEMGVKDGELYSNTYTLFAEEDELWAFLSLLDSTIYRRYFHNLIPGYANNASINDDNFDHNGRTIHLSLMTGDYPHSYQMENIQLTKNTVTVDAPPPIENVPYYSVDDQLFDALADHIKEHGKIDP